MSNAPPQDYLIDEILNEAVEMWIEGRQKADIFCDVYTAEDGELCLVYEGMGHDYGDILCYYRPKNAVPKILEECKRRFDDMTVEAYLKDEGRTVTIRFGEREWENGAKERLIKEMAILATKSLLDGLLLNIGFSLKANFDDALFLAESVLCSHVAKSFENEGARHDGINVKKDIERLANESGDKRRSHLTRLSTTIPRLRIPTWKVGRPLGVKNKKTVDELDRENAEHRRLILKAMCALYRKEPNEILAEDAIKKTTVSEEMGLSRSTLDTWLESGGFDFDDLKNEATRMSSKN